MDILFLSCTGFAWGIIVTWLFELVLKTNKKLRDRYYRRHATLFGYHAHHSTYGLLAFMISIIFFLYGQTTYSIFTFWLGIGIILMHTLSDGRFVFIEKQRL